MSDKAMRPTGIEIRPDIGPTQTRSLAQALAALARVTAPEPTAPVQVQPVQLAATPAAPANSDTQQQAGSGE
jgi:hypothetical protein